MDLDNTANRGLLRGHRMHPGDLNDLHYVGELEPDAPPRCAYQEKSSMRSAQLSPMRVNSLVMRPAISRTDKT
jgi:hypothetical protein